MVPDKGKKERKQRYLIHTHIHNKEEILKTIIVFVSVTCNMVITGIYNYHFHHLLCIPFAFSKHLAEWDSLTSGVT